MMMMMEPSLFFHAELTPSGERTNMKTREKKEKVGACSLYWEGERANREKTHVSCHLSSTDEQDVGASSAGAISDATKKQSQLESLPCYCGNQTFEKRQPELIHDDQTFEKFVNFIPERFYLQCSPSVGACVNSVSLTIIFFAWRNWLTVIFCAWKSCQAIFIFVFNNLCTVNIPWILKNNIWICSTLSDLEPQFSIKFSMVSFQVPLPKEGFFLFYVVPVII